MRFQPDESLDQMEFTITMDRNEGKMVISLQGCEPQQLSFDEVLQVLTLLDTVHQRVAPL